MTKSAEVPFGLRVDENEAGLRIYLRGELDLSTAPQFRECLYDAVDRGLPAIVLDISELDYVDSVGLGVLIMVHKRTQAAGMGFALTAPREPMLRLIGVWGLSDYFDFDLSG